MWPLTWGMNGLRWLCVALMQNVTRHEYLTAVRACLPACARSSLICILLTLSFAPLFSAPLASISPSIIRFQEFPLGVARVLRAEKMAPLARLLPTTLPTPPTTLSLSPSTPTLFSPFGKLSLSRLLINIVCAKADLPERRWTRLLVRGAPECRLHPLRTPSIDGDLWVHGWSWDFTLLSFPPGAAGNCLLWPSGLYSHGKAHYRSHMAGYKDDQTMWALFSIKFLLPPEAQSSFTGHISEIFLRSMAFFFSQLFILFLNFQIY